MSAVKSYAPEIPVLESVLTYLNNNSVIPREPMNGDFLHDNLVTVSNIFNTPLNFTFGVAPALLADAAESRVGNLFYDRALNNPVGSGASAVSRYLKGVASEISAEIKASVDWTKLYTMQVGGRIGSSSAGGCRH